jgi:hypothetical protein
MLKKRKKFSNNHNSDLLHYAGLGTQMLVSLGIAFFIGLKTDHWLNVLPLFSCVLPLLILAVIFYKLVRRTGNKYDQNKK